MDRPVRPADSASGGEAERIKEAYWWRRAQGLDETVWTDLDPRVHFMRFEVEREVLRALKRAGLADVGSLEVLDVGCGDGRFLRWLAELGVPPANLHGIDLLPFQVERARELSPAIDVREGNAESLPYLDDSMDVVAAFTTLSAILEPQMRARVAAEMLRVVRPTGVVLCFDARSEKPGGEVAGQPYFRGLSRHTLARLFPGCRLEFRQLVLNLSLADRLARLYTFGPWGIARYKRRPQEQSQPSVRYPLKFPYLVVEALKLFPFLHTHYLAIVRKDSPA